MMVQLLMLVKDYHSMPGPTLIVFSDSLQRQVVVQAKLQQKGPVRLALQPQVQHRIIHQLERAPEHQTIHQLEQAREHRIIHQLPVQERQTIHQTEQVQERQTIHQLPEQEHQRDHLV
jgi:Mg/Co/Ni transporter MgtE